MYHRSSLVYQYEHIVADLVTIYKSFAEMSPVETQENQ